MISGCQYRLYRTIKEKVAAIHSGDSIVDQSIAGKEGRDIKLLQSLHSFIHSFFSPQVLAVLLCLSSYYLLEHYKRSSLFFSDTYITLPALLAVACAAVLLLAGFLGCCLSKDSPCMQGMVSCSASLLSLISICVTVTR